MRWQNQEMPELTKGIYAARSISMSRLQAMAGRLPSGGVIVIELDMHIENVLVSAQCSSMNIFAFAQGTSIVRDWPVARSSPINTVLPLA